MGLFDWLTGKHLDEQTEEEQLNAQHADDPYWSSEDSVEDNQWIGPLAKRRDEECAANNTPYGHGQAEARFRIDDLRRYYKQYGANSFKEAVEQYGKNALYQYETNKRLVAEGYEECRSRMEFARGEMSVYD